MMQPLLDSLIEVLSERPTDRALAATGEWLRTHWQPSVMRPNASSMLVYLATHTGMLTDPSGLQEHIQRELSRHRWNKLCSYATLVDLKYYGSYFDGLGNYYSK
ncbi:unnamed protein product [Gongylonema pulchrum]|uniref:DUF2264 domain-containing protein n=1 Tax=Gongylonema pulchrum TaxID=637853 RepID=A0A183EZ70_9BILA|nr:unnamed protein product [Gongylonema pulchrum]